MTQSKMNGTLLNQKNTAEIDKRVPYPSYDRLKIKTGIVHIGVGGFHRSHQAYYIHKLLGDYNANDWGICGIGLREVDRVIGDILKKQDYLYTLITQHPNGNIDSEIIGSIQDFLLAVDTPHLVVDKMAHPDTKIVSLTITEGGYNFNSSTGEFNFNNQDVQHELKHPNEPKTIYGYITASLRKRRDNGFPPYTILSCDNIQHNGDMAREMVMAFAKKQDPELADWIQQKVGFPNSMVDRITPVTTDTDREYLENKYGLKDEWPVICEPFIQWVIENNFSNGRPPFEKLGVQFVPDVTPYEKMKIRLLNAGHSVLGILGALHGHPTIDACMKDEVFVEFMRQFMDLEATPVLDHVEGINLSSYKDNLEERFANPNIKDNVSRICSESSAKIPTFLIPTIQENLSSGGSIVHGTLIIAAWCYYSDKSVDEKNEALEIIDDLKESLQKAASNTNTDILSFLDQKDIFGDLIENQTFTKEYKQLIESIYDGIPIRQIMKNML